MQRRPASVCTAFVRACLETGRKFDAVGWLASTDECYTTCKSSKSNMPDDGCLAVALAAVFGILLFMRVAACFGQVGQTAIKSLRHRQARSLAMSTAPAVSAAEYVLVCNGKEMPVSVNSETLLKTFPRGPYTTARTHQMKSVFEFDFHNNRIAESTKLMVEAGTLAAPKALSKLVEPASLRDEYLDNVRKAVDLYKQSHPQTGEMKLTTLLTVDDAKDHQIFVHVQALGDRPNKPVKIQIMGAPRSNAAAKDSGWVTSRQGLWDAREEGVHEVVLCDEDGKVFEGLSSNFFVLSRDEAGGHVLHTAREGVLLGTVRDLALKLCPQLGIKVVEEPPGLSLLQNAEEVFISSTSRWVLPVGQVVMADKTCVPTKATAITEQLYALLLQNVIDNSTPL